MGKNKAEESKLKKEQDKVKRSHEKQLRNEQLKQKEEIKPLIENSTVKGVVENVPVSNTDEDEKEELQATEDETMDILSPENEMSLHTQVSCTKSNKTTNQDDLRARFVEQELKRHQELESELNTLRKNREKKDKELMNDATKVIKAQENIKSIKTPLKPDQAQKESPIVHAESMPSSSDEKILENQNNSSDPLETKNPRTAIIRVKPKLTKAAPPVVAIRMADLMHDTSENDASERDIAPLTNVDVNPTGEEPASADSKSVELPIEDKKLKKEVEKKERRERELMEKQKKLKEKQKKEEEIKLKKDQEKLRKSHEKQAENEKKEL